MHKSIKRDVSQRESALCDQIEPICDDCKEILNLDDMQTSWCLVF